MDDHRMVKQLIRQTRQLRRPVADSSQIFRAPLRRLCTGEQFDLRIERCKRRTNLMARICDKALHQIHSVGKALHEAIDCEHEYPESLDRSQEGSCQAPRKG
jgi:hypothetical protein